MKRTEAIQVLLGKAGPIVALCLATSLAGCALRGAPKTAKATPPPPKPSAAPAPEPSQPLSIPQTRVEFPRFQPVDPEALILAPPPPEPPAPVNPPRPARRPVESTAASAAKPEATPPPAEPERPTIQEIIPAAEQNRLRDSIERRRAEVNQILSQAQNRRQTKLQQSVVKTIQSFLNLADEAKNHGDLRAADAMAERAQVLAREFQSAR